MIDVIGINFRNILEELKVGKFTEQDLRFIIDMSKGVMEATVIVMRRNMKEKKSE